MTAEAEFQIECCIDGLIDFCAVTGKLIQFELSCRCGEGERGVEAGWFVRRVLRKFKAQRTDTETRVRNTSTVGFYGS